MLHLKTNKNISEQRFLLSGVSWQQYESLRQTLGEFSTTKITYLDHILEIMTPSPEHETTTRFKNNDTLR